MIVGTAGHIDHGKTALVGALTGVDTDRLKEEKARGISIDLGFAYMLVENASTIGFVDVPGHDKFIRNMITGATGIDFLLLVVAADDGVMPQTREHLAILDLLGITRGIVALTKIDLVPDDWREEMISEVRSLLNDTGLSEAEIIPVSTTTGEGIDLLRDRLITESHNSVVKPDTGPFRFAVDRCFTLTGAGTVVTGPVISGSVSVGDHVMLSPSGLKARIRSIHAQNRPAEHGRCGERCALNLAGEGINKDAISRGDMVLDAALHAPTNRLDCRLNLLSSEPRSLTHWTPVRVHHAAAEVAGRVAVLEENAIKPGDTGRVQLVLDKPIAAAVGDRFIIRNTSGERTMGGGRFLDLRGPQRRRRTPKRLAYLAALEAPGHRAVVASLLSIWPYYIDQTTFARDHALDDAAMKAILLGVDHKTIGETDQSLLLSEKNWQLLRKSASAALAKFHKAKPDLVGMTILRVAASLQPKLPTKAAMMTLQAMVENGDIIAQTGALRLPAHRLELDSQAQKLWDRIAPLLGNAARFRPPRGVDLAEHLDVRENTIKSTLKAMARQRTVVEIVPGHFFLRDTLEEVAQIIVDIAESQSDGWFSAAQLRDMLDNGRKVSIQILDYFDRQGVTLRHEDLRRVDKRRLAMFLGKPGMIVA
ncbi:MAG: selenocysteine-specific translation elongation factor [Rhizobiaceae bacterium]|nr:selenocysteine-specific translation elongation factor [Rhizobiaceae bacterium]